MSTVRVHLDRFCWRSSDRTYKITTEASVHAREPYRGKEDNVQDKVLNMKEERAA